MKLFSRRERASQAVAYTAGQGLLTGRHVVVVDDDDEVRRLLKTILEMEGALVSQAGGADAALELATRGRCDAVVTDITMGHTRRDGVRLLKRLRAKPELASLPVVAMTGCNRLQSELVAHGFDRVLIKPLDVLGLASMLHGLLRVDDRLAA